MMSAAKPASHSVELTGLDGTNTLGFMAALGTLVVARRAGETAACLRWTRRRTWTPVLEGLSVAGGGELSGILACSLRGREVKPDAEERRRQAEKAYKEARTAVNNEMKKRRRGGGRGKDVDERIRELETIARTRRKEWLRALRYAVPRLELVLGARIDCTDEEYREHATDLIEESDLASRDAVHCLAAFGSDACLDRKKGGSSEPRIEATPFCFIRGSGHQDFLDTVRQLTTRVTAERVAQALFEPWVYTDPKLSMRWDSNEDKRYALRDTDPSEEGARTVWMANLLGYESLALFPCAPMRRGLGTTGWTVVENEPVFTWTLWEFAAAPDVVRTLLQLQELHRPQLNRAALAARGVAAVFRARRIRFPPTGASFKLNFTPARAI